VKQAAPSAQASAPERDPAGASDGDAETPRKIREALLKTFFTGLSWTTAARGLSSMGTAARYIVFVRLLKPFDFGVIASATLICSALLAGTDPVMGQALIQQEDEIDPYLDTLLMTSFVRSLIIGLILVVCSRPLGAFFHLGDAYTVFWAMVPLPILRAIQSPRLISLYRRLDFHLITVLNVSEVAASFIFGLMAVLYWRDWRGLVFSLLAGAAVRDILTYWLFPHWARLLWSLIGVVSAVGVAYAAFIFAFGPQIVLRLFGPAWIHAVAPLKVLCIYGLLQGFLVVGRSFLSGLGHPERYVIPAAVRAGVLAIAIYPLTALHGPTGAAAAGVISILVALPIMGYLLNQTE